MYDLVSDDAACAEINNRPARGTGNKLTGNFFLTEAFAYANTCTADRQSVQSFEPPGSTKLATKYLKNVPLNKAIRQSRNKA